MSEMSDSPVLPAARGGGCFDLIGDSFAAGWNRMVNLLFRRPAASLSAWIWWGLIALLAGWGQGGGNDLSFLFKDGDTAGPKWLERRPRGWPLFDFRPGLIISLVALGLVLVVILWFLRCCFRLVFVEGIVAGRPRIEGVFGRTVRPGLGYMAFELAVLILVVVLLLPLFWAWWPLVRSAIAGAAPRWDDIAGLILATFGWGIPVGIAAALLFWFANDLVLPVLWRRNLGFWNALTAAGRFLESHLGAVVIFLLLRIVLSFVATGLACCLVCLSCCFWIWPIALMAGLGAASAAFPPALLLALPVILALGFLLSWAFATLTAPIPVFFRAWSIAFVARLDPSLGEFEPLPPAGWGGDHS